MPHLLLLRSDAQALAVDKRLERPRAVAGPGLAVSGMGVRV
jgi:hypothetical protein